MRGMKKAKDIDEYISFFPANISKKLKKIRSMIKKIAPKSTESISYGMPAFKLNGKVLVYFSCFPKHIGMYPFPSTNKDFKKYSKDFKTSKGTIQFPLDKETPIGIITHIVKFRKSTIT